MLRVRRTKHTSHRQIENMSANLRARFGEYANIQTVTHAGNIKFWINNDAEFSGWLDEWSDLQVIYFEIMRRKT